MPDVAASVARHMALEQTPRRKGERHGWWEAKGAKTFKECDALSGWASSVFETEGCASPTPRKLSYQVTHTPTHQTHTNMKFSDSPCWTAPPKGAIKATGYLEPLSWPRLPRTISLSSTSAGRLPLIQAVLRSPASPLFANGNFREENLFNAIPRVKAGREGVFTIVFPSAESAAGLSAWPDEGRLGRLIWILDWSVARSREIVFSV